MRSKQKNENGFTLIELLIVVAIIGILVAMAIPFYGDYHAKSQNATALSDLKNFRTAMEAAYCENQEYPAF